jgi:hypothetical protein
MELNASTMRKAVAYHKTAEGDACVAAVAAAEGGRVTRFLGRDALAKLPPGVYDLEVFDRCPVCGKEFPK